MNDLSTEELIIAQSIACEKLQKVLFLDIEIPMPMGLYPLFRRDRPMHGGETGPLACFETGKKVSFSMHENESAGRQVPISGLISDFLRTE